jgi:aminoglycoside 6-adenylyltransferase
VSTFIASLTEWARERDDVKAVLLLGSQARQQRPADQFSDIDLTITVDDPNLYLDHAEWLSPFGSVTYSFVQQATPGPHRERRVAFANGQLVDFAFRSTAESQIDIRDGLPPARAAVVARGYRLLIDKIGLGPAIEAAYGQEPQHPVPSQPEFDEVLNEFYLLAMVAAAKLARGEVWITARYINCRLAALLETMLTWHAEIGKADTWHGGRFLEEWITPSQRASLADVLTPLEPTAAARALGAITALFDVASREVAEGRALRFDRLLPGLALERIRFLSAQD